MEPSGHELPQQYYTHNHTMSCFSVFGFMSCCIDYMAFMASTLNVLHSVSTVLAHTYKIGVDSINAPVVSVCRENWESHVDPDLIGTSTPNDRAPTLSACKDDSD